MQLADNDVLFFYTDGLVEVENEAGDMFGSERLERWCGGTAARAWTRCSSMPKRTCGGSGRGGAVRRRDDHGAAPGPATPGRVTATAPSI